MNKKRGQVTTFVILGIIIVAAVLIVLYASRIGVEEEAGEEVSLPLQVREVHSYIASCVEKTANDALQIAGMQGGFIEIEDESPRNLVNEFSSSLEVIDGGSTAAYWFYEKSNGIKVSNVPSLEKIEREIEGYINDNLEKCADLETFEQQGYLFNKADVISQVDIGAEKVIVSVNYPINVDLKGSQFRLEKFRVAVNSDFGRFYKIARAIYDIEDQELFLENKTLDFMVVYDEIPYSGVDFSCSPRSWVKENVKRDMKRILARNIPFIKIKGGNYGFSEKDYFVVKSLSVNKDTDVNFQYNQEWPFQMEVIGHENDAILRGQPYSTENELSRFLMPIFCMNQYNFVYDIKYPVLITLSDGDDLFQFAYQVIIKNNQPREAKVLPLDIDFVENSPICEAKQDNVVIYTLQKDENENYIPLGNVDVSLACVNAICKIGKSDDRGILQTQIPSCVNGRLMGSKEGYNKGEETITMAGDGSLSVSLDKVFEKDFGVFVMDDNPRGLSISEQAYITLENLDNGYTASIVYPGVEKINLIAGRYHIISYLLLKSQTGIEIEDKKIKVCSNIPRSGALGVLGLTEKKCTEQKIEGTILDQVIVGGNDFEFDVTVQDLVNNKKVLFYIDYAGIPLSYNQISKINEKIKKAKATMPRFTNED
ncbi:MAG: hypothetical protein AABW87_00380 [Nanoarchaeota archaeon]